MGPDGKQALANPTSLALSTVHTHGDNTTGKSTHKQNIQEGSTCSHTYNHTSAQRVACVCMGISMLCVLPVCMLYGSLGVGLCYKCACVTVCVAFVYIFTAHICTLYDGTISAPLKVLGMQLM